MAQIYRRRRVWISSVKLGERVPALRATITSYRTVTSDLEVLVEELEEARLAVGAERGRGAAGP